MTAPPPATVLAADAFGRSVTGGWGSADTGGAWTSAAGTPGSRSRRTGVQSRPADPDRHARRGVLDRDRPDGPSAWTPSRPAPCTPRSAAASSASATYGARVKLLDTGVVQLHTARTGTVLTGGTLPA